MNRLILAVAAVALLAACKKSETVKTSVGGTKIAVNDSGMALPPEFPKDVPVMKEAVVKAVMGSPEQGNLIVMAQVPNAKYADVLAYYKAALAEQGWKTDANIDNGQGGMLTLSKAGSRMMLAIAAEDKNVNVQYTLPDLKKKG